MNSWHALRKNGVRCIEGGIEARLLQKTVPLGVDLVVDRDIVDVQLVRPDTNNMSVYIQ